MREINEISLEQRKKSRGPGGLLRLRFLPSRYVLFPNASLGKNNTQSRSRAYPLHMCIMQAKCSIRWLPCTSQESELQMEMEVRGDFRVAAWIDLETETERGPQPCSRSRSMRRLILPNTASIAESLDDKAPGVNSAVMDAMPHAHI
jgi:hypothetical protein